MSVFAPPMYVSAAPSAPADERVVAVATVHGVATGSAVEAVDAGAAGDVVDPGPADDVLGLGVVTLAGVVGEAVEG